MAATAERLSGDRLNEAIDVLCDAFAGYPVMRFVVGTAGDADQRMRRLTRFFVTRRFVRGGPFLGVSEEGRLVGAACLTLPGEQPASPALAKLERELWSELGDDARLRYETYAGTTKRFATTLRHHHLNMIGVRPGHAGRGLARVLLAAVHDLSASDPQSAGVSLTTETARNVALYEHFGYEVVGHEQVTPEFATWGLFRKVER
jgi:GNAT superfamily N-acetyltransferase